LSTTVTVDVQLALLPAVSVAVVVTFVVPTTNSDPDGALELNDTGGEHESLAVDANVTGAEHVPGATLTVIGVKQDSDGAVRSTTVTTPVAWLVAPFGSVTVSSTVVEPSGYGPAGD
jgi:hypothetical protein